MVDPVGAASGVGAVGKFLERMLAPSVLALEYQVRGLADTAGRMSEEISANVRQLDALGKKVQERFERYEEKLGGLELALRDHIDNRLEPVKGHVANLDGHIREIKVRQDGLKNEVLAEIVLMTAKTHGVRTLELPAGEGTGDRSSD